MYGAPMSSNGRVVPRPSERLVASNRQVPGYSSAVSGVGMLGLGITQGSPVPANVVAAPPVDRDDGELEPTPCVGRQELRVEQPGQLTDGEAVLLDDLRWPTPEVNPGCSIGPARGAADRVGPVEDDEPRRRSRRRPSSRRTSSRCRCRTGRRRPGCRRRGSRPGLAVEAGELLGRGAVRVVDRDAGARVHVVALGAAGLRPTAEAVLGPEDRHEVDPAGGGHRVDHVREVLQDAGRVGDHADPLARQVGPAAAGQAVPPGVTTRPPGRRAPLPREPLRGVGATPAACAAAAPRGRAASPSPAAPSSCRR